MQYTKVCTPTLFKQKATQMEQAQKKQDMTKSMTFPSGVDGEQTELKRTCIRQVARNSTPYKG